MIISASYKTDIPTFYGEWFMHRLRAGSCKMVNPYNRKVIRVSLARADVDGFVFWTKNVGPFLHHLQEVRDSGFPFLVQHTINGYPKALEYSVVNSQKSVDYVRQISEGFGRDVCVWRYDTIVYSSLTPRSFHLDNFSSLAQQLAGATNEVVVSFMHGYAKTIRNMNWGAKEFGFSWFDPSIEEKRELLSSMVEIAGRHGMTVSVCAQKEYLVPGAVEARCVDADRLERLGARGIRADAKGNRKECGCFASRDIGEYDTCPHGCIYCYAVNRSEVAQQRFKAHDPESEFLFPPSGKTEEDIREKLPIQLPLFGSEKEL